MKARRMTAMLVLVTCSGARAADGARLAAMVGDRPVTVRGVERRIRLRRDLGTAEQPPNNGAARRAVWRSALAAEVNWAVLLEAADRERLIVPDTVVDRALGRVQSGPWAAEHRHRVAALGLDETGERSDLRDRLRVRALVASHIRPVTPQEVAAWFRRHRDTLGRPERRFVSVITVRIGGGRTREQARARIERVRKAAVAGADFGRLARTESDEPALHLGPISAGSGSVFEAAALRLGRVGQISPVVEAPGGFHLLQLDRIVPAAPPRFEDVQEQIAERLTDERIAAGLSDLAARWRRRVRIRIVQPVPPREAD
jgi:hypothetical protein